MQFCKDLLPQLEERHLEPLRHRLYGKAGACVSFDDIHDGCRKIEGDFNEQAKGDKDVIAIITPKIHQVRRNLIPFNLFRLCFNIFYIWGPGAGVEGFWYEIKLNFSHEGGAKARA